MSSSSSSSASSSFFSSSSSSFDSSTIEPLSVGAVQTLSPLENVVRGDDPEGVSDRLDSPEQSSPLSGLEWVNRKFIAFTFSFLDWASISTFLGRYPILKSDACDGILAVEHCRPTDTICMGRSSSEGHFFFLYSCLFSDLHISLLFDDFTMDVLQALNMAPSQLYPNTWACLQTFRLICDAFHLFPTLATFLSYYTSHPAESVSWHSLISRSGNILFNAFTTSYKNFKVKFFKVFIEPEGTKYFFDGAG